jgi:hypothetical protein
VKVASRPSEILPKLRSLAGFCLSEMIELYEVRLSFFFFAGPAKKGQPNLLKIEEYIQIYKVITSTRSCRSNGNCHRSNFPKAKDYTKRLLSYISENPSFLPNRHFLFD